MSNIIDKMFDRRGMLRGTGRYVLVAAMAGAAAAVCLKRLRLKREGVCVNRGLCGRCEAINRCNLPLATDYRDSKASGRNG